MSTVDTQRDAGASFSVPAYRRIEADLRARVERGQWPQGVMLPSRKALAREYGVDLTTVQRAVSSLLADGLLRADSGRGTFVAQAVSAITPVGAPMVTPAAALTLGVVIRSDDGYRPTAELRNEWERILFSTLERVFSAEGGTTRFLNTFRGDDQPSIPIREAIDTLLSEGASALAIVRMDDVRTIREILSTVDAERVPLVFITLGELAQPIPHVFYDQRYAGYQAAEHLLRCGYRDLQFFAPYSGTWVEERIAGARQAVLSAGLPPEALRVYPARPTPDALDVRRHFDTTAYEQFFVALGDGMTLDAAPGRTPPAVIAANDPAAFEVIRAAALGGKALGRDYALIGFDDMAAARMAGLTSLRPPLEALSEEAARLLLHALRGERTSTQVRLRSHLIPRASTLALAQTPDRPKVLPSWAREAETAVIKARSPPARTEI